MIIDKFTKEIETRGKYSFIDNDNIHEEWAVMRAHLSVDFNFL